jgi:hypothetical protein
MPRYEVVTAHASGSGTVIVEARSVADARRLAKAECSFTSVQIVGVRKIGDKPKRDIT